MGGESSRIQLDGGERKAEEAGGHVQDSGASLASSFLFVMR